VRCSCQERVAAELAAHFAAQGLGAYRRQLPAQIGLEERSMDDCQAHQARNHSLECQLRMQSTEDEMGMLVGGWKEGVAASLDGRVTGLHSLLRRRQIAADENIDIRSLVRPNLRESGAVHRQLLVKLAGTKTDSIIRAKAVPIHLNVVARDWL
jgi:hypothetical protein